MKKLLFTNGFKTMLLMVLVSFIFSCQKDAEIKPLAEPDKDTVSLSNIQDLLGRNKGGLWYWLFRNRWQGNQYLCVDNLYTPDLKYPVADYSFFQESTVGYGYYHLMWWPEVMSENRFRLKNLATGTYITDDYSGLPYVRSMTHVHMQTWSIEYAGTETDGTVYYRLKNPYTKRYLHVQNLTGAAQCSGIDNGWWSAQWHIINVNHPN